MREEDIKGELIKSAMLNKLFFVITILSLVSCSILKPKTYLLKADQKTPLIYKGLITETFLKKHLSILASDEFEGRETTKKGQKKAAKYLEEFLIDNNIKSALDSTYFQVFPVDVTDFNHVQLSINNNSLLFIDQFYSFGTPINTSIYNTELVDVDYGIISSTADDYKDKDVEGKIVLMNQGVKSKEDPINQGNWRNKLKTAEEKGVEAIIIKSKDYLNNDLRIKAYLQNPTMKMHNNRNQKPHIPVFIADEDLFTKDTTYTVTFSTNVTENRTAENVVSYIPGKTNETIIISAHYDHIGFDRGEICNGADDDGSGTVALMNIAMAFQQAYNEGQIPERNIVFLMVSGEEKGLFGSQYYTDNPIFDLNSTMVNLNIDMVGRQDTIQSDNNYIYLIGSDKISKDLHKINEQVNNKHINFRLDYTYNKEDDPNRFYYRSDHYNFAKNNIPVIFYFGGLHEDYHKPSDEVEKINFDKLEKVTQYIFMTAWELAYRKKSIK